MRRAHRARPRARIPSRVFLAALLLTATGCRSCGCDEPPPASTPDASAASAAPEDPSPVAEIMGPDAVQRTITEGLRAVARGDEALAIERFEAAAAADPGRRVPHQRLCGLYHGAERWADAKRACRAWRDLETEPDFRARADALLEELEGR